VTERRNARRRRLPFVRGGVLESGGRNHIVSVTDLGPNGAFLATRVPLPVGGRAVLRMVLPSGGREVALPCQVVWRAESSAAPATITGLAVRFTDLDGETARNVATSAEEGLRTTGATGLSQRFQYRVVEAPDLEEGELNRLGLDGWRLTTAVPSGRGVRLVLLRRL
jgi:Tfp pilus assembly protein PilZ